MARPAWFVSSLLAIVIAGAAPSSSVAETAGATAKSPAHASEADRDAATIRVRTRVRTLERLQQQIRAGVAPRKALRRALGQAQRAQSAMAVDDAPAKAEARGSRGAAKQARTATGGVDELPRIEVTWSGQRRGRSGERAREPGKGAAEPTAVGSTANGGATASAGGAAANSSGGEHRRSGDRDVARRGSSNYRHVSSGGGASIRDGADQAVATSYEGSTGSGAAGGGEHGGAAKFAVIVEGESQAQARDIAGLLGAYDYNETQYLRHTRVAVVQAELTYVEGQELIDDIESTTGHNGQLVTAQQLARRSSAAQTGEGRNGSGAATPQAKRGSEGGSIHGDAEGLANGLSSARSRSASATEPGGVGSVEKEAVYDVLLRVESDGQLGAFRTLVEQSGIEEWFVAQDGDAIYLGRFERLEQAVTRQRRLQRRLGRLPEIDKSMVKRQSL